MCCYWVFPGTVSITQVAVTENEPVEVTQSVVGLSTGITLEI